MDRWLGREFDAGVESSADAKPATYKVSEARNGTPPSSRERVVTPMFVQW